MDGHFFYFLYISIRTICTTTDSITISIFTLRVYCAVVYIQAFEYIFRQKENCKSKRLGKVLANN